VQRRPPKPGVTADTKGYRESEHARWR
jgi:hypothetical protein